MNNVAQMKTDLKRENKSTPLPVFDLQYNTCSIVFAAYIKMRCGMVDNETTIH